VDSGVREGVGPAAEEGDKGSDGFTLSSTWRLSLQRIGGIERREDAQDFCYSMRYPITSIDLRPDQDALEQSGGPHKATGPDQRLKRLRFLIDSVDSTKKSLNISRMVV
jgi:hypothetical protein